MTSTAPHTCGRLLRRGSALALLLAATLTVTVACGPRSSSTVDGPTSGHAARPSATASSPVGHGASASPGARAGVSRTPTGPQRCELTHLRVTTGLEDAGSGHRAVAVVFRNEGSAACWLRGYPGVDGLDRSGVTRAHAVRTLSGYLGGTWREPQTVLLKRGGSASALVEALGFEAADGAACEPYATLAVTPPGDVRSVRLPWHTDSCSALEVHPVVAGTSGSTR